MAANTRPAKAPEPLLDYEEIAAHFGVSTETIERWVGIGAPCLRPTRKVTRFKVSAMERWAEKRTTAASA